MLYVEMRKNVTDGGAAVIMPENPEEIPGLTDMLSGSFMIENPAKTFARFYKAGSFDGMLEAEVAFIAEFANCVSDAWRSDLLDEESGQEQMNVIRVLTRLMQMCFNLSLVRFRHPGPFEELPFDD